MRRRAAHLPVCPGRGPGRHLAADVRAKSRRRQDRAGWRTRRRRARSARQVPASAACNRSGCTERRRHRGGSGRSGRTHWCLSRAITARRRGNARRAARAARRRSVCRAELHPSHHERAQRSELSEPVGPRESRPTRCRSAWPSRRRHPRDGRLGCLDRIAEHRRRRDRYRRRLHARGPRRQHVDRSGALQRQRRGLSGALSRGVARIQRDPQNLQPDGRPQPRHACRGDDRRRRQQSGSASSG